IPQDRGLRCRQKHSRSLLREQCRGSWPRLLLAFVVQLLRLPEAVLDQLDVVLGRRATPRPFLLEAMQDVDARLKANRVNCAIGIPVEVRDDLDHAGIAKSTQHLRIGMLLTILSPSNRDTDLVLNRLRKRSDARPAIPEPVGEFERAHGEWEYST